MVENFEDFKNEYFNGDEEAALKQLAYEGYTLDLQFTKNRADAQRIVDSLTKEQDEKYMDYFLKEMKKNPKSFKETAELARLLTVLEMSHEEIKDSFQNPFARKLKKSFILFLVSICVVAVCMCIFGVMDFWPKIILYAFVTIVTWSFTEFIINLIRYFKFKKAKKIIDNDAN